MSYAGARLLADLAEAAGLEQALSTALAPMRQRDGAHDPGRVAADVAVMLADGGEAISDLAVLRDQPELFGAVASPATAWRVLDGIDADALERIRAARAQAREVAWAQHADTRGDFPQAKAAGREIPGLVLDIDASIVICHSEKESATHADGGLRDGAWVADLTGLLDPDERFPAGTRFIVRRERPHPGAQLDLFDTVEGFRHQLIATDSPAAAGHLTWLDARHRAHARVEDRIRCGKDSGFGRFPSRVFAINAAWLELALAGLDLTAWTQEPHAFRDSYRRPRVGVRDGRLPDRVRGVCGVCSVPGLRDPAAAASPEPPHSRPLHRRRRPVAGRPGGGAGRFRGRQPVQGERRGPGGPRRVCQHPGSVLASGSCPELRAPSVLGLARTHDGNLYVVRCTGDAGNGVWRITPGHEPVQIAQLPADGFPNDMAVDDCTGDLYVADSSHGTVWKVPTDGRPAAVWASGPALQPHGFVGANGVAVHNGAVWVSNSDAAAVLRIAILPDGTAGPVSTAASGLSGLVDNITVVGPHDTIIVTLVYGNEVAAVGSDGTLQPLLTAAEGLQNPVAAAVAGGRLYIADSAYVSGTDPNLLEAVYVP